MYLLVERKRPAGLARYVGVWGPAATVHGGFFYVLAQTYALTLRDASPDGGYDLAKFFLACYSIGLLAALIALRAGPPRSG